MQQMFDLSNALSPTLVWCPKPMLGDPELTGASWVGSLC